MRQMKLSFIVRSARRVTACRPLIAALSVKVKQAPGPSGLGPASSTITRGQQPLHAAKSELELLGNLLCWMTTGSVATGPPAASQKSQNVLDVSFLVKGD